MSDARLRVVRSRQELQARAAGSPVTESALGHTRLRATITANNGDGTYDVTLFAASGVTIETESLVLAYPTVTTLAVGTYVWIDFLPGSEKGVLDATAYAIGGGGSGSGSVIVIGAPGFLSGT